jgi:hypothetical protein
MATSEYSLEKKSETEKTAEMWGDLLNFLKSKGFEAEVKTQFKIKPVATDSTSKLGMIGKNRSVIQNILWKQSHILSQKLREDFSLGKTTDKRIDLSLLDGSLSEYAKEKEDSVELVKSTRKRL